jgi:DNA polymerase-3 subunit delta
LRAAASKKLSGGRVFFMHGPEERLVSEAVADIKRRLLAEAPDPSTAWTVYDLAETGAGEMLSDLMTVSFFGGLRGVLALHPEKLDEAGVAGLLRYAEKPSPDVVLVVAAGKVDGRKKGWKEFALKTTELKFDPKENERGRIVLQKLASSGIKFDPAAAALMAERFGDRIAFLDSELEKLKTYLGGNNTAGAADVEACISVPSADTVFGLVEAVSDKRTQDSLEMLRSLRENGEKVEPILAMMARQFRILLLIRTLKPQNLPDYELAGECGVPPYYFPPYVKQASKVDSETLKRNIVSLSRANLRLHSTGANEWHILELEIISLTR